MNFSNILAYHAAAKPSAVALRADGGQFTYSELESSASNWASWLKRRGIGRGDLVAVVARNSPEFATLLAGTLRLGAVLAPINHRLLDTDVQGLLLALGKPLTLVDEESIGRWSGCLALGDAAMEARERAGDVELAELSLTDPALILFTSGTSSLPKGVVLTHGNLLSFAANVALSRAEGEDCVVYIAWPLYHTAAMQGQLLTAWYAGGQAWIAGQWNVSKAAEDLARDEITACILLPEQWGEVLRELGDVKLARLTHPRAAGGMLSDEVVDGIEHLTGHPPAFTMGMTEASPMLCLTKSSEFRRKRGALGHPTPYASIRVLGDDLVDVGVDAVGELCVKGPLVMKEYWGQPEVTAAAFDPAGYFHSGDLVMRDAEGYLRLLDRKKDVIRSGGETVFCPEVERAILEHPDIAEAAIVGFPHERWGEGVAAVIVPEWGGDMVTLGELQEWCKDRLASYKKPVRLETWPDGGLPRTATGRVVKAKLREWLATRGTA